MSTESTPKSDILEKELMAQVKNLLFNCRVFLGSLNEVLRHAHALHYSGAGHLDPISRDVFEAYLVGVSLSIAI